MARARLLLRPRGVQGLRPRADAVGRVGRVLADCPHPGYLVEQQLPPGSGAAPQLSEFRRRLEEMDYGMVGGVAVVECRQALLLHLLKHLALNQPQGDLLTKQVALKNEAELRALLPPTAE